MFSKIVKIKNNVDNWDYNDKKGIKKFPYFLRKINVANFRGLQNLEIDFDHPITIVSGNNRSGKTSLLLLIACSFEKFKRAHASRIRYSVEPHNHTHMFRFLPTENDEQEYSYLLSYREGEKIITDREGYRKQVPSGARWGGIAKKRTGQGGKIKNRELRFVDLERLTPARNFSHSLYRKTFNFDDLQSLSTSVVDAYNYIFESSVSNIFIAGEHANKCSYLITDTTKDYSSYNAAIGEETTISILREVFENPNDQIASPKNSLILVDEIEAGLHPKTQRRLIDALYVASEKEGKQFILTSHSPTVLACVPPKSRRFIELSETDGKKRVIKGISERAAASKMDAKSFPLVRMFVEDKIFKAIVDRYINEISKKYQSFRDIIEVIISGGDSFTTQDYIRMITLRDQFKEKIGAGLFLDGDCPDSKIETFDELTAFIHPSNETPEKMLSRAYLDKNPHNSLSNFVDSTTENPHLFFDKMVEYNLSSDRSSAINTCIEAHMEFDEHKDWIEKSMTFLVGCAKNYSN